MAEQTAIEWCDHTFNPWIGCTKIAAPCDNCYAESWAKRCGRAEWGNHPRQRTGAAYWREPLKWNAKAKAAGTRPFVFCASLADVFDNQVDPAWRRDLFELIHETSELVWLLLTKRPQNISRMIIQAGGLPGNVALGATFGTKACVEQGAHHLVSGGYPEPLFYFASCEPLLEDNAAELKPYLSKPGKGGISWVIVGGESGPNARPMHPDWARHHRDLAGEAGAHFLFKQWGEWASRDMFPDLSADPSRLSIVQEFEGGDIACEAMMLKVGKKAAGRLLDGRQHDGMPMRRAW